jgi:hypothetical protein
MRVLTPLRGLGATRPSSTDPALMRGYAWAPYMQQLGSSVQRTSCGTPTARKSWYGADKMVWANGVPGCWERNGGAWGQQPAIGEHGDDVQTLISRSTTVTTTTKPPTQSPGEACNTAWNTWLRNNPAKARCVNDSAGRQKFMSICVGLQMGTLSLGAGGTQWNDYVARRCAVPPPTASPPPPPPPTRMPPPGDSSPPADLNEPPANMNPPHDGRDPGNTFDPGGGGEPTTGARAFLRQVGPVVGIGLLAAVVFTVARKKKLLTRRR